MRASLPNSCPSRSTPCPTRPVTSRDLPSGSDADKKEFQADVTSFANAAGGDLVFGIEEKQDDQGRNTGIPLRVVGLSGNAGAELPRVVGSSSSSLRT